MHTLAYIAFVDDAAVTSTFRVFPNIEPMESRNVWLKSTSDDCGNLAHTAVISLASVV